MGRLLAQLAAVFGLSALLTFGAGAQTNSLVWHTATGTVDADIQSEALFPVLQKIAAQTGWHVYLEPDTTRTISAKFQDASAGDALKMLLGNLNFALVPKLNTPSQLYIFRTEMKNATRFVAAQTTKHVPNQLLVKVKPGTDINALAKMLGAKIVGRMDKYGAYLLQFNDADATDSALSQLQSNSDIQAVDYNNYFDPPPTSQAVSSAAATPLSLTLNPPPSSGKVIVGLIDTSVDAQSLGADAEQFILSQINVADGTDPDSGPSHGTAMASLILQAIQNSTGNSTSVQILPVNVYGSSATATDWNVALGIQQAINNGATILNMSLGSSGDSAVLDGLIAQAASDNITMFAAAGNTPTDSPYYPAADSGVIAVTALAQAGELASYANSWADPSMIALPGTGVFTYDGNQWVVQGTSTAAAISSGVFAGNVAAHGWTPAQTVSAMENKFPVPK